MSRRRRLPIEDREDRGGQPGDEELRDDDEDVVDALR
jgi:hypothetical protein